MRECAHNQTPSAAPSWGIHRHRAAPEGVCPSARRAHRCGLFAWEMAAVAEGPSAATTRVHGAMPAPVCRGGAAPAYAHVRCSKVGSYPTVHDA